jgi:hypothetical protein
MLSLRGGQVCNESYHSCRWGADSVAVLIIRFEIVNKRLSENEFIVRIFLLLTLKSKKNNLDSIFLLSYCFFHIATFTAESFITLWDEPLSTVHECRVQPLFHCHLNFSGILRHVEWQFGAAFIGPSL